MFARLASIGLIVLGGALLASTTAVAQAPLTAEIKNSAGEVIGSVRFEETAGAVRISGEARGVPPGTHGFHIHAVGTCTTPDFKSAGGHFNPLGKKHGLRSPEGPHAGDLPNLEVGSDGVARLDATAQVTISAGPTTLFDADGSALVIHANPDDEVTDPTGNAGDRIACAVIAPAPAAGPAPAAPPAVGSGGYLGGGGTPVLPIALAVGGFLALALAAAGRKVARRSR